MRGSVPDIILIFRSKDAKCQSALTFVRPRSRTTYAHMQAWPSLSEWSRATRRRFLLAELFKVLKAYFIEIHNLSDEFFRWLWVAQPCHIQGQGRFPLRERPQPIRVLVANFQSPDSRLLTIRDVVVPDITADCDHVSDYALHDTHMPDADPLRDFIALHTLHPGYPLGSAIEVNQLCIHVQKRRIDGHFKRIRAELNDCRLSLRWIRNSPLDLI